ncbi:uncharacterized protein LOC133903878 isoform X1 [Phragmites australis]|uniref:uncharacterized protein LOC133903878 isoform X1 n=1 Tax=Phragmites australis TaxID=29695 RepID=UPI002D769861|nr:uncharacterized protein LOC133903878 isoform X1 [Phragmites australis]
MVKIVEVDEQPDAERDGECYEIDIEQFSKKVNLKETDDVIVVAAKGKMVKVEVEQPEDLAETSDGYDSEADCLCILSSGVTHENRHEFATGDSMDNPYKIEEDEPTLLQTGIDEDRFALVKSSAKFGADDRKSGKFIQGDKDERRSDTTQVTPDKIVVKSQPDDHEGIEGVDDDANDHCLVMNLGIRAYDHNGGRFFHGDKDERRCDTVVVISDKVVVKLSEPVDGNSVEGCEEGTYDHCLEMARERRVFDEEDDEDVVVVEREAL